MGSPAKAGEVKIIATFNMKYSFAFGQANGLPKATYVISNLAIKRG
jgi:hypothetical protein